MNQQQETTITNQSGLIPAVNRIVIGDVGSGKTIVALVLAVTFLRGLENLGQVAMLAPTEVLATQHYDTLLKLKSKQAELLQFMDCIFLTNKNCFLNGQKLTRKKLELYLNSTEVKTKIFWVGTHALLFTPEVRPDLVLVDEQHRFGVRQRQFLTKKKGDSQLSAHFVSFTATPIPRTLALTLYKSLKPHFLPKLKSRQPIQTQIVDEEQLDKISQTYIQKHLQNGRKVYVVCPKIEEEDDDLWSVGKASKYLEAKFPGQVLSVHGKLGEKSQILDQFKTSQDKNILVATSVIEVGIDVGQASLMLIFNPERFGLAALHQIRGRIGRNNFVDNQCLLVTNKNFIHSKRLSYVIQNQDGFALAEKDLELRGSGKLLGTIQSGFDQELDRLLGLPPDDYQKISNLVDQLDFAGLDSQLPRLKKFLEKETEKIWEE
jgi:ATP-dependent DNA helicase RecG